MTGYSMPGHDLITVQLGAGDYKAFVGLNPPVDHPGRDWPAPDDPVHNWHRASLPEKTTIASVLCELSPGRWLVHTHSGTLVRVNRFRMMDTERPAWRIPPPPTRPAMT